MTGEMILVIGFIAFVLITWLRYAGHEFNYDPNNPARRFCAVCDQEQHRFAPFGQNDEPTWQNAGMIKDPNCRCHDHVE